MDEEFFFDGIFCIGSDASCVCGNYLCDNSWNQQSLVLSHNLEEHELLMHAALKALDCGKVSQLLQSGMKLCCRGEDCCISIIAKQWPSTFLSSVFCRYPSTLNTRGPRGETLLMMCDTAEKFELLLAHGADVNALSDGGDSVLLHNVKYLLAERLYEVLNCCIRSLNQNSWNCPQLKMMIEDLKKLLQVVINSGVVLNVVDSEGRTALEILLHMFQPGYMFHQYHYYSSDIGYCHDMNLCCLENELASFILSLLLEAGAEIPPPDQHGRTALMLAVQSPWNFNNMKKLIERGVDVNAVDAAGQNTIHYLLASYAQHSIINYSFCSPQFSVVDEMVCYLLDLGCSLQGMELTMFRCYARHAYPFKVLHYLMARKTSSLREKISSLKIQLKNDPSNLSFLSVFLETRGINKPEMDYIYPSWNFALEDVSFAEQEVAAGLNVTSGTYGYAYQHLCPTKKAWCKKLCLPYPLLYTLKSKLSIFIVQDGEDLPTDDAQEQYQAVEGILRLLLPFWRHPPLALMIFEKPSFDGPDDEDAILLRQRLMKFLYEVGGPLTPGSEIYRAVEDNLKEGAEIAPAYEEVLLPLFQELHREVPSLLKLSRSAMRANLRHTNNRGLDVSSLRFLSAGEMIPLPQEMVDFINFRDSPVSVIKVVPEMLSQGW